MKPIPEQTCAQIELTPQSWHTAAAIGNEGVTAVSTPAIIGFLEQASLEAIKPYQDEDEISVGVRVALEHVGPAFVGEPVICRAAVRDVAGRRITFDIAARQGERRLAIGEYMRVVLPAARFYAGRSAVRPSPDSITFWFDFHSPWSYIAATRLPAIASRHGCPIRWVPIHVARLIETIGGRRPLEENPAFVTWYRQDLADWAARAGLTIRYHPKFPLRPARALRASHFAIERGHGPAFVLGVMRAYWTQSLDISDPVVLAGIGAEAGLEPKEVNAATSDERLKVAVEDATRAAIERGVFGVPSFEAEGKLFFGNDRLEMLDDEFLTRSGRSDPAARNQSALTRA
jgi:2-hydroxychromene-2-carboxylate isomerase/predicted thioesterase